MPYLSLQHQADVIWYVDSSPPDSNTVPGWGWQEDKDNGLFFGLIEGDGFLKNLVVRFLELVENEPIECRFTWLAGMAVRSVDEKCATLLRLEEFVQLDGGERDLRQFVNCTHPVCAKRILDCIYPVQDGGYARILVRWESPTNSLSSLPLLTEERVIDR